MSKSTGKTGEIVEGRVERRKGRGLGVQLTAAQVAEILGAYVPGVVGYKRLATRYAISAPAIAAIVKGRSWRGVSGLAAAPTIAPRIKAAQ